MPVNLVFSIQQVPVLKGISNLGVFRHQIWFVVSVANGRARSDQIPTLKQAVCAPAQHRCETAPLAAL